MKNNDFEELKNNAKLFADNVKDYRHDAVDKAEVALQKLRLQKYLDEKEEEDKQKKTILTILAIVGCVALVAAIAYAVYRLTEPDYLEDFDDYDDDEEPEAEEVKASEEDSDVEPEDGAKD